jgi:hypothetical protein
MRVLAVLAACLTFAGCSAVPPEASDIPANMYRVTPVAQDAARPVPATSSTANAGAKLSIGSGQFFNYALPQGWHLGEDGQFALTTVAPDNKAFTVMVGNAGLPPNYPPDRYAYEKMMAMQPQNLRIGQGKKAAPVAGFAQAYAFDVEYSVRGAPQRGVAKVHIAPAYDTATMAMTAAISAASQWPEYASWLPLVADQIAAKDGRAFGARGVMAQNLKNSTEYAEAARQYREWSQKTQQGVTDARNASQDRNNTAFRENLGAVQTYVNPYDSRVPVELPATYKYFWVDAEGTYLGTDDSSVNPNVGSTREWKQMPKRQP